MRTRLVNLRVPADDTAGRGPNTVPADVLIEGEKIAAVIPPGDRPCEADERRIDLEGQLVLPGAIDGHVHFDDPGFTHRENFETGTRSAAAGGVTCIVDMPCTSLPPVTSRANLEAKLAEIEPKAHVDFMLWGGVS
ncbi:MAG: allantoinase, partial [Gemmatimonadota bacterium]